MSATPPTLEHLAAPKQQDYLARQEAMRETVYWQGDPDREVWEFDPDPATPPPAPDWYFVVNHPRTGSTVVTRLLNAHPDIYCGMEHQVLPLFMTLLGSHFFMPPKLWHAARYLKRIEITPTNIRRLMDAWRGCVSDRPIFGDKGEMYFDHFGDACAKVFPGCRTVLTVRNLLDTLASYTRQFWTAYLYDLHSDEASFHHHLRQRAYQILDRNRFWRPRSATIVFEEMTHRDSFVETFRHVFEHLGADPGRFDWDAGFAECAHAKAIGRWRQDPKITAFLDSLKATDSTLHQLLLDGTTELPEGVEMPEARS